MKETWSRIHFPIRPKLFIMNLRSVNMMAIMFLVVLIRAQAVSGLIQPKSSNAFLRVGDNEVSTKVARFHVTGDTSDEERVSISGVLNIGKFASTPEDTVALGHKITTWLHRETNPTIVFKELNLGRNNKNLAENPVFRRWVQYVQAYQKKNLDFQEYDMYTLLKNSNSESRLVNLVHSMRQFPETKTFADNLQFRTYSQSRSMRKAVEKLWLRSRVSPEEAFKIYRLNIVYLKKSIIFHPWLRYTELFRRKHGVDSFTDVQLLEFLLNRMKRPEPQLGIVLQTLKSEGFENLGERLQKLLFQRCITGTETPQAFGDLLVNPYGLWSNLLALPKTDARFKTLEGYTLQYAEEVKGKALQESAKKMFDDGKPQDAITLVMKTVNVE